MLPQHNQEPGHGELAVGGRHHAPGVTGHITCIIIKLSLSQLVGQTEPKILVLVYVRHHLVVTREPPQKGLLRPLNTRAACQG